MSEYQLTDNPDVVLRLADRCAIPRGHRLWADYEAWLAAGNTAQPVVVTREDLVAQTKSQISAWLDSVVQARGYDNIVSCASYAASTNEQFRAEATAAIAWRDAVYAMGYEILANTPAGVETPDNVLSLLPLPEAFGWPVSDSSDSAPG